VLPLGGSLSAGPGIVLSYLTCLFARACLMIKVITQKKTGVKSNINDLAGQSLVAMKRPTKSGLVSSFGLSVL
jgi:hypothetical protein